MSSQPSLITNQFGFIDAVVYLGNGALLFMLTSVVVAASGAGAWMQDFSVIQGLYLIPALYVAGFLMGSVAATLSLASADFDGDDYLVTKWFHQIASLSFIPGVGGSRDEAMGYYAIYRRVYQNHFRRDLVSWEDALSGSDQFDQAVNLAARQYCVSNIDNNAVSRLGLLRKFTTTSAVVFAVASSLGILLYILSDGSQRYLLPITLGYLAVAILLTVSLYQVAWDQSEEMAKQGLQRLLLDKRTADSLTEVARTP